jgi:hypothetical protein
VLGCKNFASGLTYAQKACCGATKSPSPGVSRSKNDSDAKSLISLKFFSCTFLGRMLQILDLAGLPGRPGNSFNKVIHTNRAAAANRFGINDLPGLSLPADERRGVTRGFA